MRIFKFSIKNTWSMRAAPTINSDYPFLPVTIKDLLEKLANSYNTEHILRIHPFILNDSVVFYGIFSNWYRSLEIFHNRNIVNRSEEIENQLHNQLHDSFPRGTQALTSPQKTLVTGLRNTLIRTRADYKHKLPIETSRFWRDVLRDLGLDFQSRIDE